MEFAGVDPDMPYDGRVLERKLIGEMKCYFVENDSFPLTAEEIEERKRIIKNSGISESLGYAVVWQPDITIGRAEKRGLKLSRYDIDTGIETKGVKRMCFIDGIIHGEEQKILMDSENKDDYLSTWCLQERFKQESGFIL